MMSGAIECLNDAAAPGGGHTGEGRERRWFCRSTAWWIRMASVMKRAACGGRGCDPQPSRGTGTLVAAHAHSRPAPLIDAACV